MLSPNHTEGGINGHVAVAGLIWVLAFPASYLFNVSVGHPVVSVVSEPLVIQVSWIKAISPLAAVISLVIAAPLVEEFAFRGFLLSALGFWGGATVSNTFWVSLHATYPWHALSMIFVFGMLLSLAIWRTGSLWTCIVAHGLYNLEPALFQFIFVRS